jgi:hypothetical protein
VAPVAWADKVAPGFAPATNAVLAAAAAGRPGTRLVAWSELSRDHGRDWFDDDLVHVRPGADGRASLAAVAYADAIADQVDRCTGAGQRPASTAAAKAAGASTIG